MPADPFPVKKLPCLALNNKLSALTGPVTDLFRGLSPRQCQQPAPARRLATPGSGDHLGRFSFRLLDDRLTEQQTEEASAGVSKRPTANVADWLPLSLVNLALCLLTSSSTL